MKVKVYVLLYSTEDGVLEYSGLYGTLEHAVAERNKYERIAQPYFTIEEEEVEIPDA